MAFSGKSADGTYIGKSRQAKQSAARRGSGGLCARAGRVDLAPVQSPGGPRAGRPSPRSRHLSELIQPPRGVGALLPGDLASEGISFRSGAAAGARRRGSDTVRSEQIKSLNWRGRKATRIGKLPADVLEETGGRRLARVDAAAAR